MQRVSAREAHALMTEQGYAYLDVRSVPEFEEGHPAGAYNVPWLEPGLAGMEPNPAFLAQVATVLPRDAALVVGCASGVRSLAAACFLVESGYTQVSEQRAGVHGTRDPFGRVREPGWRDEGLPMASEAEPLRSHRDIVRRSTAPSGA